jgi:hypothetical protein
MQSSKPRIWITAGIIVMAGVALVSAEMVIVHLTAGGSLKGDLARVGEDYSLRTDDGLITLRQSDVERIENEPKPDITEEYERRRSAVPAHDIEGHADILVWLIEEQNWPLAAEQCELILRRRPSHRLASRWWDQLKPLRESEHPTKPTLPSPADRDQLISRPEPMTPVDINRIRWLELTPPDQTTTPPRMRVRDPKRWKAINAQVAAIIRRDDDEMGSREKAYLSANNAEQLYTLATLTGTAFADEIEVVGDPEPLRVFRQRILPLVRDTCARSGCHSATGAAAGFRLPRTAGIGDRGVYAAFYQLSTLQTEHGPLINRESPQHSALIQYMLPTDVAMLPHPELPEGERIVAPFHKQSDPYYEMLVDWIRSLKSPQPVYDLEYRLP